jgi:acetyl esterase/lipase
MGITTDISDKELKRYTLPLKILSAMETKEWSIKLLHRIMKLAKGKNIPGLVCEERFIPSKNDGPDIRIRIFKPQHASSDLPGLLYLHGGGYMLGVPEIALGIIKAYIETRPCVIVAPDYRKSISHPYPAGFNDGYDTLLWMKENATLLGIKPDKLIVGGHSAGGGLTAAIAIKARDTNDVQIAFQMPFYPMIDHRQMTVSAKTMDSVPVWNSRTNEIAWRYYLQNLKEPVPPYASPTLNDDYTNLPPAISFVGHLDPFRDETIHYMKALNGEQVPIRFEIFTGAFHGFEIVAKNTTIGKKANEFELASFAEYFDKYAL